MQIAFAFLVGTMVACGIYLILDRNLVRFIFGLVLLSNAVNLLIFTMGRLNPSRPPLIPAGETVGLEPMANALPQALVLTAIVIGFALLAFVFVLFYRTYQEVGTIDTESMRAAEPAGNHLTILPAATAGEPE